MLTHRVNGIASLCLLAQVAVASLSFWAWALGWASVGRIDLSVRRLESYLVYNQFLVIGLFLAAVLLPETRNYVRPEFRAAHQFSLRQIFFALFFLFLYLAALKDNHISRAFVFTFIPLLYGVLLASNRYLPPLLARSIFHNANRERVLLVGPARKAERLGNWLSHKRNLGFETAGILTLDADAERVAGLPVLGEPADLEKTVGEHRIKLVLLLELPLHKSALSDIAGACERLGVRLLAVNNLDQHFRHSITIFEDDGVCLIGLRDEPLESPYHRLLKRTLDLTVALPVVLFVLPITTLAVWLAQRVQSPGPVFYRQTRTGLQHRAFQIIKYRSMHLHHNAEARQATMNDSRIFPAGRWLRRYSIDELPQFLNVLRGEMSVVGPRPHLLEHDALFARAMNSYPVRSVIKPGITGLAQVEGHRGETATEQSIRERVRADLYYVENWSLALDCKIILRTIGQMLAPPKSAV